MSSPSRLLVVRDGASLFVLDNNVSELFLERGSADVASEGTPILAKFFGIGIQERNTALKLA